MISRLAGTLTAVGEQNALVENAGLTYEVLLPTALAERLKGNGSVGQKVLFETIYYIEAGDKKSSHFPRIVGFTDPIDREFFSLYTQVSGIGVRKALKSLVMPIKEIAAAIEMKDSGKLRNLPGVGPRLAEKIVAELNGKVAKFALLRTEEPLANKTKPAPPAFVDDAREVLTQLQYRHEEAERMITEAFEDHPKVAGVEELIRIIFRNEQKAKVSG